MSSAAMLNLGTCLSSSLVIADKGAPTADSVGWCEDEPCVLLAKRLVGGTRRNGL